MQRYKLKDLLSMLSEEKISSQEILKIYIQRIAKHDTLINSFITVDEDAALEKAKQADQSRQSGDVLPLTGIPFASKDIFCTKGVKTTCGSKMLSNFVPPYDATVIANLNERGAILLGKTNMDEFAMGSVSYTHLTLPTILLV